MMQDRYYYPAVFIFEEGQKIAVDFPDFGVATSGKDELDALSSARELLGITILGYEEDGEDLPVPSSLKDMVVRDNERPMLVDVFMPSVRDAERTKSVKRTVTLPAWLNAKASEYDVNVSKVLQDALKEKLKLA